MNLYRITIHSDESLWRWAGYVPAPDSREAVTRALKRAAAENKLEGLTVHSLELVDEGFSR